MGRMSEDLQVARRAGHFLLCPEPAELGAGGLQPADETCPRGLADMAPVRGTQLGDEDAQLVGAIQVRVTAGRKREGQPQRVPVGAWLADHTREKRSEEHTSELQSLR